MSDVQERVEVIFGLIYPIGASVGPDFLERGRF
jgi:hypothetical protein